MRTMGYCYSNIIGFVDIYFYLLLINQQQQLRPPLRGFSTAEEGIVSLVNTCVF